MTTKGFDLIVQELVKQQHLLQQMQKENYELRRQIADLRAGRGLIVKIDGQLFMPREQLSPVPPTKMSELTPQNEAHLIQPETPLPEISEQPKREQSEMPLPKKEEEKPTAPTFLEEIMIDEFALASTHPMTALPQPTKKQKGTQEEQMATLRRELTGSFLLE